MSFIVNSELAREITYYCRLKPTMRLFEDWSEDLFMVDVYVHALPANFVDSLKLNGTTFAEVQSLDLLDLSAGDSWYFDTNGGDIYVKISDLITQNPLSIDNVYTCDYEVCVASKEVSLGRDPTDDASSPTQYSPGFDPNFSVSKSVDNVIDGFMPSISSTINIINIDYSLAHMFYRSTLSKKDVVVYVSSGARQASNTFRLFEGTVTNLKFTDSKISLSVSDKIFNFDGSYTYPPLTTQRYSVADFPSLEPDKEGNFIKVVYGIVQNIDAVNTSFVNENALANSTDNATHTVCKHYGGLADSAVQSFDVLAGGSGTQTFLADVSGINVGDEVLDTNLNSYARVTGVDRVGNSISHLSVAGTVIADGGVLKRDRIASVHYISKTTGELLVMNRNQTGLANEYDYIVEYDGPNQCLQVRIYLEASTVAIIGETGTGRKISCRVYGEPSVYGITGEVFPQKSDHGVNTKWHQVVYEYLRSQSMFSEEQIQVEDFLGFDDQMNEQEDVGFYVPKDPATPVAPKHKDVIGQVLKSSFASLSQTFEGKLSASKLSQMGEYDFSVNKDEILSLEYEEKYLDTVDKVIVSFRESDTPGIFEFEDTDFSGTQPHFRPPQLGRGVNLDTYEDADISRQFGSSTSKNITTVLVIKDQASRYAERAMNIYGYPFATFSLSLPVYFLDRNIGDVVQIERNLLAGTLDPSSSRAIKARIISINFNGNQVRFKLWTQLGIEDDNSGAWT